MRLKAAAIAAFAAFAGLTGIAKAGALEVVLDPVTLHRDCNAVPCLTNNLTRQRIWVHERYLRYDIHTRAPRYALRRTRVVTELPGVAMSSNDYDTDWYWLGSAVRLPAGHYKVVHPAQYAWVTRPVLVSPARNYVTRRHPYYAYYPDRIVVESH